MGTAILSACASCGKPPKVRSYKYCSHACRVADKKPAPCTCKSCSVVFTAIKFVRNRAGHLRVVAYSGAGTCTQKCHNDWIRNNPERKRKIGLAFSQEKHPNWQGGKSALNNVNSRGPNWQKQRLLAINRDGDACVDCGMTGDESAERFGRGLDVDHVIPFHNFSSYRKANQLSNLACRCQSCHRIAEARRSMVQMVLPMQDGEKRSHKGRARGEKSGRAKLNSLDILKIRSLSGDGSTLSEIAAMFFVSKSNISSIVGRKTWAHI